MCTAHLNELQPAPCLPQAAGLLAAVQLQPQEEADVGRIKAAIVEAQAAGAAAAEACEEVEASCRARLLHAAPADAEQMKQELVSIGGVRTAWQELAAAAAEREARGVELLPQPSAATGVASEASSAAALSSRSGTPSAAGSRVGSARLVRRGSTASAASSVGSRAKQSRGPSRAAREAAA